MRGVSDLGIFRVLGQPNLNITVDRDKAARYGLNTGDVNTVVQAALGGTLATTVLEGDRQFDLTVRLAPEYRASLDRSATSRSATRRRPAPMPTFRSARAGHHHAGHRRLLYLSTSATQRFIPIKFSVRGRDLGSTVAEAQAAHRQDHHPAATAIASNGPASSRSCSRPRRGSSVIVPIEPRADPGAALWPVQFVARQPAGPGRNSLRHRAAA